MKLANKAQIRAWDQFTINEKKIKSLDLMEQASSVFVNWFQTLYFDKSKTVHVLCGSGNNGGDGLCVGRFLTELGYDVQVHLYLFTNNQSIDNKKSQDILTNVNTYSTPELPSVGQNHIIIDALLGSGISGKLQGKYLELVLQLNSLENIIVSIDIPSGLDPDQFTESTFVKSNHVLSFEIPKMSFFIEDHFPTLSKWDYRSIGLSPSFIQSMETAYHYLEYKDVKFLFKQRSRTSSKFSFGFGQLCGGSEGMFGAVILAARAALKCGIGRLAGDLPGMYVGNFISVVPEAMTMPSIKNNMYTMSSFSILSKRIDAVAVGPGLGKKKEATEYINQVLERIHVPLVLDADALNIIAKEKWQRRLPKNTIITPHKLEFEVLFGKCNNHYERILLQQRKAVELSIYIVLKGAFTTIATPDGKCYFNNTGNVGMATGGSGDVLTGMILAFRSQGYSALNSCLIAVYAHGAAGDLASLKYGTLSLVASNIVEYIPETLKNLYGK